MESIRARGESISSAIREMQNQDEIYCILTSMATMKDSDNTTYWQGCSEKESLLRC